MIVAHFYDVESGRKELHERGSSLAHQNFKIPIPRDGSVADLLEEAQRPDRRFAAVICESIERVARRTYFGTKIEYELEQAGVALCTADEPIITGPRAKRATPTLTRRVKQAVSEWYVLQMLELSWDGFVEHVSQGWNVGKPPYGYRAEKVPHPVPARRAEGRTKHRLIPDPLRASAVTHIFQLRGLDKLGYDAIADRLNLDLVAYPPPEPTRPDVALGRWSGSAVREILRNPKYTGYQVWNRRAMKKGGRYNDPRDWVWSPRPAHEPLVTKELFDAVSTVGRKRQGSRSAHGANAHPATKRSYVLRSYVYCDICDRRMFGKTRHQIAYYACQPDPNEHRDQPWFPDHPKSLWIREQILVTSIARFFATRIFRPDRHNHLTAALRAAQSASGSGDRTANERAAPKRAISAIGQRQARLNPTLAGGFGDGEADGLDRGQEKQFREAIRREHSTVGAQREQLAEQLAHLRAPNQGVRPTDIAAPLNALPHLDVDLSLVPEEIQRRLYSAFGLEVRYCRPREELTLRVTIPGCLADGLLSAAREPGPWNKKSGARTIFPFPEHAAADKHDRSV
ncbi:recombinase family protein [Streptomyces violaceus]|uniref:recombinase family protein n=1 Tax=Streptomyces violaceus TaxID=1936 RepID=UPI002E236E2A